MEENEKEKGFKQSSSKVDTFKRKYQEAVLPVLPPPKKISFVSLFLLP